MEILELPEQRLVTAIEMLSPSNKAPGPDRDALLAKRDEYLATGVNLVEIDLLRRGRRLPLGSPEPPPADYYVLVCQAAELPCAGLWPIGFRDPLPDIPIPLDPGEPEVYLPLRWCLDRTYDEGRYTTTVNYRKPLKPRPSERDAAWGRALLARRVT